MTAIRPAILSDAVAAAGLLTELGYPASESEVGARLAALDGLPGHALFMAVVDGDVAGLCQVQILPNIAGDGYAEIHALVVAQRHRRKGVGMALVRHAVDWATVRGERRVRLRSGVQREDAHRFYEADGSCLSPGIWPFCEMVTLFHLLKGISLTAPLGAAIAMGSQHRSNGLGLLFGVTMAVVCFAGMKRFEKWLDRNVHLIQESGFKSDLRGNLLFFGVLGWIVGCSGFGAFLTVQIAKHGFGT